MFHDLDDTLKNMLTDPAAPAPVKGAAISFLTPDRAFNDGVTGATIDLFLHRVRENRELREAAWIPEPGDDPTNRKMPILRVDCSYLVTTWSKDAGEQKVQTEHKLLGLALQWLSRVPEVPAQYLVGSLKDKEYPQPVALAAQLDPDRVPVDFWTGLGIAPRPSFDLTVTIAMKLDRSFPEGPPVVVRELDFVAPPFGTLYSIGGTVRASAGGLPIEGATVELIERGQRFVTLKDGQFQFNTLAEGRYRLKASAGGHPTKSRTVNVPLVAGDETEKYDFSL